MNETERERLADMRQAMVASQLRTSNVNDPRVVEVMARTPREEFMPADARALAYRDTVVPLGKGRVMNTPLATGRLLTEAVLNPSDKVLLIGAAGGYTAALLAQLVASVVAVEEDADLVALARPGLARYAAVNLVQSPLAAGHAAGAPYDVLVVDGAVEQLPDALVEQVALDGRVVTGLVDAGVTRLAAGRRTAGGFGLGDFADLDCAVLPGFARPRQFVF